MVESDFEKDKENTPGEVLYADYKNVKIFEKHKNNLPNLKIYLSDFWRRKVFSLELARFSDKAEYLGSKLGKSWLVLNPLLLALVYFLLVLVIRGGGTKEAGLETLAKILIGLFTFYFAQNCINDGAQSITSGGKLILNQSFPLTLLPLSSMIKSLWQYIPTIPVYFIVIFIGRLFIPDANIILLSKSLIATPYVLICLFIISFGLSLIFATINVYFRDTGKLLTYITRIWLYATPVLWSSDILKGWHKLIVDLNPLGSVISSVTSIWVDGKLPTSENLLAMSLWAVFLLIIGGYIFISRERDFAVRL